MNKQNGHDRGKMSVPRHFIISAVLILALLVVIPLTTVYLLTQTYDEQIRIETSQISTSIRQTVRSFIDGAYNLSYELSVNPSVLTMDEEIQTPILAGSAERNDYVELLYITGIDGMQTARSSGECGDRSGRWWFLQIKETKQPFVSKSYYSVSTNMPCTAVFIPMYRDSEMIGVYGADLSLEYIQQLVEKFANPARGRYSFIIDGEGVVLAHPDNTYLETLTNYKTLIRTVSQTDGEGNHLLNEDGSVVTAEEAFTISADYKALIEAVMDGRDGLEIIDEGGATYYMSYEPISLPGYSDSWSVITLQDRSVAMSVITQLVIHVLLIILLIFIVFIALIVRFFRSLRSTLNFLENARSEAENANKSKSNFLATMSHEIRTPMNAILGITQIQLQKEDLPDEYSEVMEMIYSSGNNLLRIINDILDMSKIETGKLELVPIEYDIPSLINDTVQLNILRIGDKQMDFLLDVDENLPAKACGDVGSMSRRPSCRPSACRRYNSRGGKVSYPSACTAW